MFVKRHTNTPVMPGLVPGIHVFLRCAKNVDGRDKPGHDGVREQSCHRPLFYRAFSFRQPAIETPTPQFYRTFSYSPYLFATARTGFKRSG
jgi:hypothetical protein